MISSSTALKMGVAEKTGVEEKRGVEEKIGVSEWCSPAMGRPPACNATIAGLVMLVTTYEENETVVITEQLQSNCCRNI